MAELKIRVPGVPERTLALENAPVVLGRAEDCDVQLLERRASKRHLRLERVDGGAGAPPAWVAVDLQSSNGTVLAHDGAAGTRPGGPPGDVKVLRRVLAPGDVLRVGDATIEFVDGRDGDASPAATGGGGAIFLSGALVEEPAVVPAPPPPPAIAAADVATAPSEDDAGALDPLDAAAVGGLPAAALRSSLAGRRSIVRAAVVLGVAVLALVAVELLVGRVADDRGRRRAESDAYEALLATRDQPWDQWSRPFEEFRATYPASRHLDDLARVADAKQRGGARFAEADAELDALRRNVEGRSESDLLGRLLELRNRVGDDTPVSGSLRVAVEEAVARRREVVARAWAVAEAEVDRALSRGDAAAAMRRLTAFAASHVAPTADEADRLAKKRASVFESAAALATAAIEAAWKVDDPDARRRVLFAALPGLADTPEAERMRGALARVAGGAMPTAGAPRDPGASGPAPAAGPSRPGPTATPSGVAALEGRAVEAEIAARERRWSVAADAFRALADAPEAPARRKADWAERADDLAAVTKLVDDLAAAAAAAPAGGPPLRVKLAGGVFDVLAADAAGVRLRRADAETTVAWPAALPEDVVALLAHGRESPARHLGLAIVCASLADRAGAMRHLLPLVELPAHRDRAFAVMAHRVDGRTSVPDGGYFALDGELLERGEFQRRTEVRHLASIRDEAKRLVEQLAHDPAWKPLERLRARRDELDRRRAFALIAIFDETHWPYPHDDPTLRRQYDVMTEEITRRWRAVQEVWDEPLKIVAPKGEALAKAVARHEAIVRELQEKGQEADTLRAEIAPYAPYVEAGTLTVRSFFRTPEERDLLAYNRWVVDVYNPSRTTVIADAEREQVRITNEYRMMMGWAFAVRPGPDPYTAVDPKTVEAILAKNVETSRTPLRAVRVDDRLVTSARAHSRDMATRGFFAHQAPANPATGEPSTSPFDRMQKAGYGGGGMSENICASGGPMDAHLMWLRSSGHHRNIVSDWADMGAGFAGPWTQNFGVGGGAPTEIPGKAPPPGEETPSEGR